MTSAATEPPSTRPPRWEHCGHGADPASDPIGCCGAVIPGSTFCLAHAGDADRDTYLAGLEAGADIDHRGTPFTADLLARLLHALEDDETGQPHIGRAQFGRARFGDNAWFYGARFGNDAWFSEARFGNDAQFSEARFGNDAQFDGATFGRDAWFYGARFGDNARFRGARFGNNARFYEARFGNNAQFRGATFGNNAQFREARFGNDAQFDGARFGDNARFGEATFGNDAQFDGARFGDNARFGEATFGNDAWFYGARFGNDAWFSEATFGDHTWFYEARFGNDTWFSEATFGDHTWFSEARFGNDAQFDGATFGNGAQFLEARFGDHTWFSEATFGNDAQFGEARFGDHTWFGEATFGNVWLTGVVFRGKASWNGSVFGRTSSVGPLVCAGELDLSGAVFETAVTIEAAAAAVRCRRTRWGSTAALRLRHATVDLTDAVMEYPVSIAAHARPFTDADGTQVAEPGLTCRRVQVISLRGADAAHLVLTDVDLTVCRFASTIHLDQLRLEGRCPLPTTPPGLRWHGARPVRWTSRRTLAEEHHWRAARASGAEGWTPAPDEEDVLTPAALAPTYRQLRKAFEDGKNEPGAADFYYGEMEMRRHDDDSPWAERALLAAYWAVSGYGLRASRAIGWLLVAVAASVGTLMLWGLPQEAPKATTTGRQVSAGHTLALVTDTPDPVSPDGPLTDRLTYERFGKALHVTLESGLFRSAGQDLTNIGTGVELVFRFTAPIPLALAVLAVRGRVKR